MIQTNPARIPAPDPPDASPGVMYFYDYDALPAAGSSLYLGVDAATYLAFDRAYIRSKPPEVQALWRGMAGEIWVGDDGSRRLVAPLAPIDRFSLAIELAKKGFVIDKERDYYNMDPYFSIYNDLQAGVSWTSPMLTPPQAGVGPVPVGMIKLSLDPVDYPPFIRPPAPVPPSTVLVGDYAAGTIYFATKYAIDQFNSGKLLIGDKVEQGGKTFYFKANRFLMGWQYFFDTQQ